jgi:peptidyl-prolyl cis-trans isomerase B (cyclophilin B)
MLLSLIMTAIIFTSCGGNNVKKTYSAPPPMTIDTSKQYIATMKTERGNLVLELFAADAPKTVNNFVFLAREGFYDNTIFHRVIAGFMAQGGDPTGTGSSGPGYKFTDEFSSRKHLTGTLSMANSGANTNGSQFFICYAPQPHLDGKHAVFGQLTSGMDVMLKIKQVDKLIKVTIEEK